MFASQDHERDVPDNIFHWPAVDHQRIDEDMLFPEMQTPMILEAYFGAALSFLLLSLSGIAAFVLVFSLQ